MPYKLPQLRGADLQNKLREMKTNAGFTFKEIPAPVLSKVMKKESLMARVLGVLSGKNRSGSLFKIVK
jgi:hypothetical protein